MSGYTLQSFWVFQSIIIFTIIYMNYVAILFLKDNNSGMLHLFLLFINVLLLILLYNEFYRFFYSVNYYYNNIKPLTVSYKKYLYMGISGSDYIFKTRTMLHYSALVIFLKF